MATMTVRRVQARRREGRDMTSPPKIHVGGPKKEIHTNPNLSVGRTRHRFLTHFPDKNPVGVMPAIATTFFGALLRVYLALCPFIASRQSMSDLSPEMLVEQCGHLTVVQFLEQELQKEVCLPRACNFVRKMLCIGPLSSESRMTVLNRTASVNTPTPFTEGAAPGARARAHPGLPYRS
jgi:hypothetical protein